jgi:MATE family multidrug resistance protein
MMLIAASYFFCGEEYLEIFRSRDGEDFQAVMETGLNIMRFLALYCLADGLNVGFASALQAVGDTKWVAIVMGSCTLFFSALLCIGMKLNCGIYGMWTIATVFVMVMPLFWIYRFCGGKWKKIQVA